MEAAHLQETRLLMLLMRCYEAIWPSKPLELTFPSGAFLLQPKIQTQLVTLLESTKVDAAAPWRRPFWKHVMQLMESAITDAVSLVRGSQSTKRWLTAKRFKHEEEVDGALYEGLTRVLTTPETSYVCLFLSDCAHDRPTRLAVPDAHASEDATRLLRKTFFYGPLGNPTDCVRLIEQRAAVSQGQAGAFIFASPTVLLRPND